MVEQGEWIIDPDDPVLVTGAAGFIGTRVVKILLDYGFHDVRALVRPSSHPSRLRDVVGEQPRRASAVSILRGNLLSKADCARAVAGVRVVYHLAAGIEKSFAGCFMNSVLGTRNLLDATGKSEGLKRFVNVSSFAVYSTRRMPRGALLDESAPVETHPMLRHDPYGYAKLKQEEIVRRYQEQFGIDYVILRPGAVYGPGRPSLSGRIGIDTFGVYLHLGGSNRIPLTFVDNCAEAVVRAGLVRGVDGHVLNVVDDALPTSRQFLRRYKREAHSFTSIPVPYRLTAFLCGLWERYSDWSEGQLPRVFNLERCSAEWKGNRYSNQKLKRMLGWEPRIPFEQASRKFFESVRSAK